MSITAQVTYTDSSKKTKFIPNTINVSGYLTTVEYKPFFNSEIIPANELDSIKKFVVKNNNIKKIIGSKYEQYLMKWGANVGCVVEDHEAVKNKAIELRKKEILEGAEIKAVDGDFGIFILERLPENIFLLIKKYGTYHSKKAQQDYFDDVDDFYKQPTHAGWFYTNEIVSVLNNAGYKINVVR